MGPNLQLVAGFVFIAELVRPSIGHRTCLATAAATRAAGWLRAEGVVS